MVDNIYLPADQTTHPHDLRGWGQKVKFELFQNMVMLHMKFKEITKCINIVANGLPLTPPPHPPPPPVAYQSKWNHKMQQHGSNFFP